MKPNLILVEPASLLRWSVATYLAQWFSVWQADSKATAVPLIDEHRPDALVLSDELPSDEVKDLKSRARLANAAIRVVLTVTGMDGVESLDENERLLEKPFALGRLGELLRVSATSHP